MPPSTETFIRRLRSESPSERLQAARYFAEHALPEHERIIQDAIANESIGWIRGALRRALARISPQALSQGQSSLDGDDLPAAYAAQVYAEALETTASQLIHEIEPLLGTLRLAAEAEVQNFDQSNTRRNIDRLDDLLAALSRLRRAASAPKIEEFSLDELVQRHIQEVAVPAGIQTQKSGTQPCVVEGDIGLVALCLANGLRNAIEATEAKGGDLAGIPITIAWGTTDKENWISVVDLGVGFKGSLHRAFDIGTTTKSGHLGMGLATAKQALTSMGGQVMLVPNERGVRFEMRWPKKVVD
jgi:signal transduction histidine kinase